MSVSASEIDKMVSSKKAARRRYTEEYRVEAVKYYERAREIDPKKTIKDCARELGINEKTFNDWVIKFQDAGKVTRGRSEEQKALDDANRRIRELELENEFLKKAGATRGRATRCRAPTGVRTPIPSG